MYKTCAQRVDKNREKPVQSRPQYPLPSPLSLLVHKVTPDLSHCVPTIHSAKSQLVHSRKVKSNRGISTVFPLLHTAYYYYY